MLLSGQHEDGEDELGSHEHLDEEALSDLGQDCCVRRDYVEEAIALTVVVPVSLVRALRPPGMSAVPTALAAMAATNCTTNKMMVPGNTAQVRNLPEMTSSHSNSRYHVRDLVRKSARVTAGLKRPPETRKKIQALTASERPKPSEEYMS